MYLRIETKIAPLRVGKLIYPDLAEENFDYDMENQFEWLYLRVNGLKQRLFPQS